MSELDSFVRDVLTSIDGHDLDAVATRLAADCDFAAPGFSGSGAEAVIGFMGPFLVAFPDVKHGVVRTLEAGDGVAIEHRDVLSRLVCKSSSMSEDAKPESPSAMIDAIIEQRNGWRGELLSQIRGLIRQAVPDVVEEIKWQKPSNPLGVPVWTRDGIICTGETYKDKVKVTFAKGASLQDAAGLFNASLDAKVRRVIDLCEGDGIDGEAFKALVRAAAELNAA